jgi:hypothetical protein
LPHPPTKGDQLNIASIKNGAANFEHREERGCHVVGGAGTSFTEHAVLREYFRRGPS